MFNGAPISSDYLSFKKESWNRLSLSAPSESVFASIKVVSVSYPPRRTKTPSTSTFELVN
jgi:hypothetical protein